MKIEMYVTPPVSNDIGQVPIIVGPSPVMAPAPVSDPRSTDRQSRGGGRPEGGGHSELQKKPASRRYQSLDMWRGAACLMLLFYHTTFYAESTFRISDPSSWTIAALPLNLIRKLWIGVPIFFVISGYCIAASIDSLRRRDYSLRDYFTRRVRRIYPPLWIMYGCAIAFISLMHGIPAVKDNCKQLPNLTELTIGNWFGNLFAAESWLPTLSGDRPAYLMANTWTLCYEEQFYLIAGLILAFAARRFFTVVVIVTLATLMLRHGLRIAGIAQAGFFWDGHWLMFAAGILVYHALTYQNRKQQWGTAGVLFLGMMYGVADRVLTDDPVLKHLAEYLVVAGFFGIALMLLRRWDHLFASHWLLSPITWCGKRSYSIYLTHFPIVVVISSLMAAGGYTSEFSVATFVLPLCVVVSLPVAWLFYVTVESRFLNAPATDSKQRPVTVQPLVSG